eukprot:jgi/Chlat1/1810/Chrsp135S02128
MQGLGPRHGPPPPQQQGVGGGIGAGIGGVGSTRAIWLMLLIVSAAGAAAVFNSRRVVCALAQGQKSQLLRMLTPDARARLLDDWEADNLLRAQADADGLLPDHHRSELKELQPGESTLSPPPTKLHTAAFDIAHMQAFTAADPIPMLLKINSEELAEEEEVCGSWMSSYAEMHRKAMAYAIECSTGHHRMLLQLELLNTSNASLPTSATPRKKHPYGYVVYRCRQDDQCGGFSDRLTGMVTAFMFALVTNRAFLLDWPRAERAFYSPHINWGYTSKVFLRPEKDEGMPNMPANPTKPQWGSNVSWEHESARVGLYNWHGCDIRRRHWNCGGAFGGHLGNLSTGLMEDVAVMTMDSGAVSMAFREPALARLLGEKGLKAETAFSCFLHFIMRPAPTVRARFQDWVSLLDDPNVFSIGIHIIVPAKWMVYNTEVRLKDFDEKGTQYYAYFRSAEELAAAYAKPGQRVVWFLATNSANLKVKAMRNYPDKLIATPVRPGPVDRTVASHLTEDQLHENLIGAVGDWWLLSKCDFLVMRRGSGFAKTALAYSFKTQHAVFPGSGPFFFLQLLELAEIGSGL